MYRDRWWGRHCIFSACEIQRRAGGARSDRRRPHRAEHSRSTRRREPALVVGKHNLYPAVLRPTPLRGIGLDRVLVAVAFDLQALFVDTKVHQPLALPQELRDLITAYESGAPMVRLRTGAWNELGRDAERLRTTVFVQEQGVPREIEIDELDPLALHAVAYNGLQLPVATGRLVTAGAGVARIGRMAVDRSVRGGHLGRQVLDCLVEAARQRGDREVVLHAQCHAQAFYEKAGFTPRGDIDEEAGIPHIMMGRLL